MIKQGTDGKELIEVLKELDSYTSIDNILTHGQNVTIRCKKKNGKLSDWTVEQDTDHIVKKVIVDKGNGYDSLLKSLEENVDEKPINENITILCFVQAEPYRTYDGKIITKWIVINPAIPFELDKQGMPSFPMMEIKLTNEEYKLCMQTRMALYDEFNDTIYPILEVAFSSIGKLLDSAASFKNLAQVPLGSALLLAERFATDLKKLKLIFRNASGKIKPLIGLAGDRFVEYKENEFFTDILNGINGMFTMSTVGKWEITDALTQVKVYLSSMTEYKKGELSFADYDEFPVYLRIQTSDIPGMAASATAFAVIDGYPFLICRNAGYHWEKFRSATSKSLLKRKYGKQTISIKEDIDNFLSIISRLKKSTVRYNSDIDKHIKKIIGIIGKRQMAGKSAKLGKEGKLYNGYKLLMDVLSSIHCTVPEKQTDELLRNYGDLARVLGDSITEKEKNND